MLGTWAAAGTLPLLPVLTAFGGTLGWRLCLAGAAPFAAASWYWAVRLALRRHQDRHMREAQRLGHHPFSAASAWAPWQWFRRGLPVAFRCAPEERARLEADLSLIRTDLCERRSQRPVPSAVAVLAAMACGFSHPLLGFGPAARLLCAAAALAGTAALSLFWALFLEESWGARCAQKESGLGHAHLRPWPFRRLYDQRARQRNPVRLRRDFRLALRVCARIHEASPLLELGSGGGVLWEHALPPWRRRWVCTDLDRDALRWSRGHGRGDFLVRADALRLPFRDASFGCVLGLTFFDAVTPLHVEAMLGECRRILKPGGRLVHLQDFPDWPGKDLLPQLNKVLGEAGTGLSMGDSHLGLVFPRLAPAREPEFLERLDASLQGRSPAWEDRVQLLRKVVPRPALHERFSDPQAVFCWMFARALRRAGLRAVDSGRRLRGRLSYLRLVVGQKPLREEPPA